MNKPAIHIQNMDLFDLPAFPTQRDGAVGLRRIWENLKALPVSSEILDCSKGGTGFISAELTHNVLFEPKSRGGSHVVHRYTTYTRFV